MSSPVASSDDATVDRTDPLVGRGLRGYEVRWPIADGGMARVYELRHRHLGHRAALKVLHPAHAARPDLQARFEREAKLGATLPGAHRVRVLDLIRMPDGRSGMICEWLEGEDLGARLVRDGTLPPADALAIVRDVARGLSELHARGVVHRDLKPGNVFLCDGSDGSEPRAVLLDLGVARLPESDELTMHGCVVGTPAYMAPEQARGEEVSATADIYALGALLFRMLGGTSPFPPGDATATLARVAREPAPPLASVAPDVPASLSALVDRCLSGMPAERPMDASAFLAALNDIAAIEGDAGDDTRDRLVASSPARRAIPVAFALGVAAGLAYVLPITLAIMAAGLLGWLGRGLAMVGASPAPEAPSATSTARRTTTSRRRKPPRRAPAPGPLDRRRVGLRAS